MTKLQSLQHVLLDRHLDYSEDDEALDSSGGAKDKGSAPEGRRFMKIAHARKEQLLERILLEQE